MFSYLVNYKTKKVKPLDTVCKHLRLVTYNRTEGLWVFYQKGHNSYIARLSPPKYFPASFKVVKAVKVQKVSEEEDMITSSELFGVLHFDMADRNA